MRVTWTARLRHSGRRLRRWLGWSLLTVMLLAALGVALASQLLPLLAQHPEAVAHWLSGRIGGPVSLAAVDARWNRAGPELSLSGLRIGTAPDVLDIDRAQLQVNIYAGLWPGVPFTALRLQGPELELRRARDGRWRLEGFGRRPAGATKSSQFEQLDRFGAIDVVGARLRFQDDLGEHGFELPHIDARLRHQRGRLHLGALLHGEVGTPLHLAADLSGDLRNGTLYLEGLGQDWATWLAGRSWQGVSLAEARGDARVWLDLVDGELGGIQLKTTLAPLALHRAVERADGPGRSGDEVLAFASWQLEAQLQHAGTNNWSLALPHWRVVEARDPAGQPKDAVRAGQVRWNAAGELQLQAESVALAPLAQIARLLPQLHGPLRQWLAGASPHGSLRALGMYWSGPADFRFRGQLEDAGWHAHHRIPSLEGIHGALDGDAAAMRLQLAPGRWDVVAPGVLREPLRPQVDGEILLLRNAGEWRIDTPGLRLREDDYDILLAGGVQFPGQDDALLDLRADVAPAPIVVAKRFWPINVMPPPVVHWLDTALLDGQLAHGAALVRGKVRDWPFRHGEGRFEALAELAGARLKYHQDWPAGHGIDGTARFVNTGMDVDLRGGIAEAAISRARGGIPNFGDAVLQLEVAGSGSGSALLAVLRQSPLQQAYGEFLQGLELGGRGVVGLDLRIPLEQHLGEPGVDGHVDIERMDMHDSNWGLGFQAASGRVRFSQDGFSADELNVGFAGSLAALSIAVGDYTSRAEHLVEASLRGRFPGAALAASNEHSRWLEPWFQGESDWTVQLTVPQAAAGPAPAPGLRLRSDLVGTAITLPAPLRKAASDRLALDLRLGLPFASSGLDLRLGRLLRVQGRLDAVDGFNGIAVFGDAPDPTLPPRGLRVAGQVPVLDTEAWATAFTRTTAAADLYLDSAELFTGELHLLGRRFRETGITVRRDAEQLDVGFTGPALDGSLAVPLAALAQKGITGNFQRLHWPTADPEAEPAAPKQPGLIAPAAIPPLHLESHDTRFGDAQLGNVWLETWPTREGLHVERLDIHSPALDIKATGDWVRTDAGESSEVALDYSSHDAGDLLTALGFSRLLDGGATHGRLRLRWSGAPDAFDWSRADGALEVSVGQGRVLEMEPGAGRLFGLLSLTEIPRRLMLDFSDFFQSGFAFNQMSGNFLIEKGDAVTEEFRIDAPSAVILLRGRTGLQARDYDQIMVVLPKAGSVLPALGAIAAGPAGAAVGAVAQALLRQPLKEMTRVTYRITGPWAEPRIEVLERGAGP